jgi:exopolyphosphatase/guanosine-5'-triphosphate,3'-diphosphate pyrophosphatase
MPTLAAIDVGSNAIRLAIAEVDGDRQVTVTSLLRESVRLGQDVFTSQLISEETIDRAVEAFKRFREAIDQSGARWTRAVATSATREALNRDLFIDRIAQASGIEVSTIGTEEEARLIHLAVAQKIGMRNKAALLIDIGGGSTEVTLATGGNILSTESFKMGAVRMLQQLEGKKHGERHFNQLVQEYVEATQKRIKREVGNRTIDLCVGTGGNVDTIGELRKQMLGRDRDTMVTLSELDVLIKRLQGLTFEERVAQLRLRPDRADVIVPAAVILQQIMKQARVDEAQIPHVGLKDGLLIDMVQELYGDKRALNRDQVMASAMQLGRKYAFDEQHGTTVARHAVELFDRTRNLHNLPIDYRLLLEVAALLHDIGNFVNSTDHHKHTQYLLMSSPIVGLTEDQMAVVSNVARYHRKSMPKPQHDLYRMLPPKDRVVVSKLAAILRLADAMDNEHAAKVSNFEVDYRRPKFLMRLRGEGDLLLEKWSLMKKAPMFEEVFSVKLVLEE